MRDVHVVEVLDGHDDVLHEFGRLALRELLLLLDALEELAAAHALHHDLQTPLTVLKGLPQLHKHTFGLIGTLKHTTGKIKF